MKYFNSTPEESDTMDAEKAYSDYLDGNDAALGIIVETYKNPLIFFIMGYVGSFSEAEDITEDVFFRLAVKKPRVRNGCAFSTLLYTMARSEALSALRKRKRHRYENTVENEAAVSDGLSLEEMYLSQQRSRAVHRALERLPEKYREVIHLAFFEGLKNGEISVVTGKSRKQTENLIYRAKAAMKKELEKEDFKYEIG